MDAAAAAEIDSFVEVFRGGASRRRRGHAVRGCGGGGRNTIRSTREISARPRYFLATSSADKMAPPATMSSKFAPNASENAALVSSVAGMSEAGALVANEAIVE